MNGIGLRIRDCRKRASMTQQDLAAECGVSRAAIAQWELGVTHPSTHRLLKAGAALNVDAGYLLEGSHTSVADDVSTMLSARQVPIIDFIHAADLISSIPRLSEPDTLVADEPVSAECFALTIEDRSMAPDLLPGDTVIIEPKVLPEPGDFVLAHVQGDDQTILRKFRPKAKGRESLRHCELAALNADWPAAYINTDSPGKIIGTVIERRRYRPSNGAGLG